MYIIQTGYGVGDILFMTSIIKAIVKKYKRKVIVLTKYPELFKRNSCVLFCLNEERYWEIIKFFDKRFIWRVSSFMNRLKDRIVIKVAYEFPCRNKHLMDSMANSVGIKLLPEDKRPFLYLSKKEIQKHSWAKKCIAVQSSSMTYWTPNKNWFPERMQKVVDWLKNYNYSIVQLGSLNDIPLENAYDLRGKTTLWEGAAILANCRLLIGLEGGLVHTAKAVGLKSVVIYTGYTRPEETGYPDNINIFDPNTKYSCWSREPCHHCKRSAENISVKMVIDAVMNELSKDNAA